MWQVWGQNFFGQKLCSILAQTTPKFFTGKHVSEKKIHEAAPLPIFEAKRMWHIWGQNSSG
jgi:hypothetical protein